MEAVALKACVSKATLYRRFPSKHELVAAALRTVRSVSTAPDTGSFRGDLLELVRREVARAKRVPHIGRLAARLLGDLADEPDMLVLVHETVLAIDRERLGEIVRRGIARGELRAKLDVALATELLHASLIFRFLTSGGRLSTLRGSDLTPLIDTLLAGLARRSISRAPGVLPALGLRKSRVNAIRGRRFELAITEKASRRSVPQVSQCRRAKPPS